MMQQTVTNVRCWFLAFAGFLAEGRAHENKQLN